MPCPPATPLFRRPCRPQILSLGDRKVDESQIQHSATDTQMRLLVVGFGALFAGARNRRLLTDASAYGRAPKVLPMPVPTRVPDFLLSYPHPFGTVCKLSSIQARARSACAQRVRVSGAGGRPGLRLTRPFPPPAPRAPLLRRPRSSSPTWPPARASSTAWCARRACCAGA